MEKIKLEKWMKLSISFKSVVTIHIRMRVLFGFVLCLFIDLSQIVYLQSSHIWKFELELTADTGRVQGRIFNFIPIRTDDVFCFFGVAWECYLNDLVSTDFFIWQTGTDTCERWTRIFVSYWSGYSSTNRYLWI